MDIGIFVVCADGCCRYRELVNAHRVSKRAGEEVIISLRKLGEDRRKSGFLFLSQVQKGGNMPVIWSDCFRD